MSAVLPADDAFTENATAYGYSPNLWLRCRPIPAATATVSLSGSLYTITHKPGHLTDAYTQLVIGGQTVADTGLIDNGRAMICGLYRSVYATEVAVECDYNIRYQGGSTPLDGTDYFFGCGLWARVSGGTISGAGTRDEFHQDVTGYWLFQQYRSPTERRYALCRVVSGVVTVLADVAMTNTYSPGDNVQGEFAPRKLRMEVTGTGATVTIKVVRHRLGFDETVLEYADVNVARIVAAGRCGLSLHMPGTWNAGASSSATSLLYFKVDDLAVPAVPVELVRDEFGNSRTDRLGARVTPADQLGTQGRSLMSGWTGDSQGQDDAPRIHHSQLLSDVDNSKVGDNLPASNTFGWHISQRPNPSVAAAFHRSASVRMLNSSAVAREVGMALRFLAVGAPATDYSADSDTDKAGYVTVILYDGAGGNFTAELRSYRPGVSHVVIATASASDAALSAIVFGTAFTLDFEVQTVNGARIVLRSKIGAAAISWTPAVAGVAVNGEWVLDNRGVGFSTFIGFGEGFFFDTASAAGATPYATVDTWAEVALSSVSGLSGTPDNLWPSVEVQSETFGLVGTLLVDHSWPVTEEGEFLQNRSLLRSGHTTVFPRTRTNRRRWSIHANAATRTQREALLTFYNEHRGPEQPFSWVTPGGETVRAKFVGVDLVHALLQGSTESFGFGLIEVFADPSQGTFPDVGWDETSPDNPEASGDSYWKIHREDGHIDETYTVRLSSPAPVGGTTVAYLLGGDAIESTDYAVQAGASPLTFAAGTSTQTVTINFLGNTSWHHERLLTLTLTPSGSSQVNSFLEDENQLRIYIQPDTLMPGGAVTPPVVDFDAASSSYAGGAGGGLHSVPLTITPDTGGTDEDVQAHYLTGGTAVDGTDYTLGVDQGGDLVDVSEGNTGSLHVNVLPGFTAARTVILTLDYEAASGADMNLQNNTGAPLFEHPPGYLGIHAATGHGEYPFPADSGQFTDGDSAAVAAAVNLNLRPLGLFTDPLHVHPDTGMPLRGAMALPGAPLAGEMLTSRENEVFCDGAEVLQQFGAYNRFSVYVVPPSAGSGVNRSRFFRQEIYNENADLHFAVHWDSESVSGGQLGGGAVSDSFGLSWGINSFSEDYGLEGGAGNDFGVDVSVAGRTRLWFIYHEDNIGRVSTDSHRSLRSFWPSPWGIPRFNSSGSRMGGNLGGTDATRHWGEGWLFYDPMLERSASVLSGAPGAFWPREGHYWRPRGNCLQGSTTTVHTVTL